MGGNAGLPAEMVNQAWKNRQEAAGAGISIHSVAPGATWFIQNGGSTTMGTTIPDPSVEETARHNAQMERMAADQRNETKRHNQAMEGKPPTDTLTLRNPRTGEQRVVPKADANAFLGQGWVVYDPVEVRNDQTAAQLNATKLGRANSALATIDKLVTFGPPDAQGNRKPLKTHPGLPSVFGVVQGRMPTVRQSTADAEALINQVVSMATLPEMELLRGLGPASDRDMAIVQNGATTLQNRTLSDKAAITELGRIYGAMQRLKAQAEAKGVAVPGLTGGGTRATDGGAGAAPMPTGSIVSYGGKLYKLMGTRPDGTAQLQPVTP